MTDPTHRSAQALALMQQGRLQEATALLSGSPAAPAGVPAGVPSGFRIPTAPLRTAGGGHAESTFTCAAGSRTYRVVVPSGAGSDTPLVVMLHGGTQNAADFAAGTGMDDLAQRNGFAVLYPEQSRAVNAQGYWQWFRPEDQRPGSGEPAILAGLTRQVVQEHSLDGGAVFVAGLSAGGAMAAVMGATHPELFRAVGVHSGLGYRAAHDVGSAWGAMRSGTGEVGGGLQPLMVIHGDRDSTVAPGNADQLIRARLAAAAQAGPNPLRRTESRIEQGGRSATRTVHTDRDGATVAESLLVHGAGHAWFGGDPAGSYTDPRGPRSSQEFIRFFLQVRGAR